MKKITLFCMMIGLSVLALGQNVHISGEGKDLANKTIKFYCVEDRFSQYVKQEAEVRLSEGQTEFDVSLLLDGVKELIVRVDLMRYSFIAEPGMKYRLEVTDFDFSKEDSLLAFTYGMRLPVKLSAETKDGINVPLAEVDQNLGEFVYENRRLLFMKDSVARDGLLNLRDSLSQKYRDNEYMATYIKYEFESILYSFYLTSRKQCKTEMFANSPILYDNIGYADCFSTVFENYFSKGYKYIKRRDMESWLLSCNYAAFNDALGRDKILANEVFRELVFLQGMKDAYLDGYFNKSLVLKMLDKFQTLTKFDKHRTIAHNMTEYLSAINAANTCVGDYELKDVEGNTCKIGKNFNGKPTLVSFVKLDNIAALKELESIHFCYDSIKNNINILTICCDDNFEKMYNFVKNNKVGNKYRWDFLYFDNNYDMVKAFHLRTFPTFVLIDEKGKIVQNPFESPSFGSLMKYKKQ